MGIFDRGASPQDQQVWEWVDPSDGHEYREAIQAAVGPLATAGNRKGWAGNFRQDVDQTLRDFDRHGPSFLGFYLDLISDLGQMLDLEIQNWDPAEGKWVTESTPQAAEDLRSLRGPVEELGEILSRMIRMFELPGEMAFLPVDHPVDPTDPDSETEVRYMVVAVHVLEEKKVQGVKYYILRDTPDAKPGSPGYHLIPESRFHRIWRPDPDYPGLHWTPLQRAIPELRRFRNITRTISRNAASKLLNAGLLWIKGEARDLAVIARNDGPGQSPGEGRRLGYLGVALKKMIEAAKGNLDDILEQKVAAAFPHPFVSPNRPEVVNLGRPFDPEALNAKKDALEDFARGQNVPMSVLMEGQGSGTRLLNEIRLDEAFKETGIFPKVARVCNGLTTAWLRPMMIADGRGETADDRRVWFSKAALNPKPDTKAIESAVRLGVLERRALASALGQEEWLLDLPEGMTEAEWLLTLRGGAIANEANKSREGIDFGLAPTADDIAEAIASRTASAWWEE